VNKLSCQGQPSCRSVRGFTLIELIITIVLLGLLAAAGTSMLVDNYSTASKVDADNIATAQARYALERLAREMREIKVDNAGNSCITTWTANSLAFYKTSGTYNGTACTASASTVTITISNPNLTLATSSPIASAILSNRVTDNAGGTARLAYFTAANGSPTVPGEVRKIVITLTVNEPESGQPVVQSTRVALRNQGS